MAARRGWGYASGAAHEVSLPYMRESIHMYGMSAATLVNTASEIAMKIP